MKAWRIKVFSQDRSQYPSLLEPQPGISWSVALKRFLFAILSWAVFGIGFLMSLFRRDKLTFHDMATKTELRHVRKT